MMMIPYACIWWSTHQVLLALCCGCQSQVGAGVVVEVVGAMVGDGGGGI